MTNAVRQAVIDRRQELNETAKMMRVQWQEAKDQLQARRNELNGIEAQIADLDAWLEEDKPEDLPEVSAGTDGA